MVNRKKKFLKLLRMQKLLGSFVIGKEPGKKYMSRMLWKKTCGL